MQYFGIFKADPGNLTWLGYLLISVNAVQTPLSEDSHPGLGLPNAAVALVLPRLVVHQAQAPSHLIPGQLTVGLNLP